MTRHLLLIWGYVSRGWRTQLAASKLVAATTSVRESLRHSRPNAEPSVLGGGGWELIRGEPREWIFVDIDRRANGGQHAGGADSDGVHPDTVAT